MSNKWYLHKWLREREMFYLTTHSTHFICGYMASDKWLNDRYVYITNSYGYNQRVKSYAKYVYHSYINKHLL